MKDIVAGVEEKASKNDPTSPSKNADISGGASGDEGAAPVKAKRTKTKAISSAEGKEFKFVNYGPGLVEPSPGEAEGTKISISSVMNEESITPILEPPVEPSE